MNTKPLKKILLITLISLFLFIIGLFLIIVFTGSSITIGRYIQSDTGEHLVTDKTAPTVIHSKHDFMFRNLSSGDKILVIHGLTNLSYPGSTDAYFCMKLSDGEITDVPAKILLELYDLGWISKSESNFPHKFNKNWSYIHFNGSYNSYVFHNYADESWTENQLAELDYILNTIDFPYLVMQ